MHRKENIMAQINWLTSYDDALALAKTEDKLIFADFFNPN